MSDIVKEAQELLKGWKVDCWGLKEFYLTGTHREIVEGLLERIQELEEERDTLTEVKDALLAVAERFVKERNAALEGKDILQGLAEGYVKERDAALERVRVLEPILEAALIMDTKTQNHWAALESGDPELLKPEVRSQSYAQMITAENKVFDLIKPFRKLEATNA